MKTFLWLLPALVLAASQPKTVSGAEQALADPAIPDSERITYVSTCENVSDTVFETTSIDTAGRKPAYAVSLNSGYETKTMQLDKATMRIVSVRAERRVKDAVLHVSTVVDEKNDPAVDEVRVVDFSAIRFQLRGFPFNAAKSMRITTFYGQDEFSMKVKLDGTDKIKAMGRTIECYKLVFNVGGLLGMFLPKTSLWYSTEAPHYLVAYEGSSDQKRTKKCRMTIVRYETGRRAALPVAAHVK